MSNEFGLNEYELELAKRGGVIVASYSQENNGDGGSFNKSFLVKKLAENVFIAAETLSEKGGFLAQESFRSEDIDDFYLVCMATREQCMEAGVEYIEPPILDEAESMRQDREMNARHTIELELEELRKDKDMKALYILQLEDGIRNLHKVKGRYHTQQALESLFKLVGLENNIGEKMSEKTLGQINEDAFIRTGIKHGDGQIVAGWEIAAQAVIEAHEARKWQTIEALKDGVNALLISDGQLFIGAVHHPLNGPKYARITSGEFGALEPFPTHFQHLPQPPKEL